MLQYIRAAFSIMLLNLAQLSAGCLLVFAAAKLKRQGVRFTAESRLRRAVIVLSSSLSGILLPLGPFGALPALAAGRMLGLEIPCILPLFVSGFIFNLSMPLTEAVFTWKDNWVRIAAAFSSGALAGFLLACAKAGGPNLIRRAAWSKLFSVPESRAGYFHILKAHVETAGLAVVAGALLNAALDSGAAYRLQNLFFSTDIGYAAIKALSIPTVFNPAFVAALQILGRLVDFTALSAAVLLFKIRNAALLYGLFLCVVLVLSVSLFM